MSSEMVSNSMQRMEYGNKSVWWKRPLPWVVAVLVVGAGVSFVSLRHPASTTSTARVTWVPVSRGNVVKTASLSGTLNPANEVTLTGSGKLLSVAVKVGDTVKQGQVIAHLDASSYQIQLSSANAQLAQAKAKLAQAQEPVTTPSAKGIQTSSPDPNAIAAAQANVDSAQAQVDSVQQQINSCTITSPIAGTVLQISDPKQLTNNANAAASSASANGTASSGNNLAANAIAVIADLNPADFEVQANVTQSDIGNLQVGMDATVSLSADSAARLTGKVETIGYLPTTQGGVTSYPVVISANAPSNPNVKLFPGETAAVDVVEQRASNVLTVPSAAISQMRGRVGVYVKDDGSSSATAASGSSVNSRLPAGLKFQPITVGLYGGNNVEVTNGLSEGDQVAIILADTTSGPSSTNGGRATNLGGFGGFGGSGFGGGFGGGGYGGGRRGGNGGSSSGNGGNGGNGGGH